MGRQIVAVNGSDRSWTRGRFILWFGEISPAYLMVWANGSDDAFDEAVDWVAKNAPGLLCDEEVAAQFAALVADGMSEEEAAKEATCDVSTGGNAGHHVLGWHWGILVENPTREQVKALQS